MTVRRAEEKVAVPGGSLWTVSSGEGPPLVLAHGGPGLSNNLDPVAAMVDDLARVHLYDQRGGGRSTTDGPFDIETFVADLESLREHWGHDRWVVGGHSWGAALALFYALTHPERTLGVIYLSGTATRWGFRERAHAERMRRLSDSEREEVASLQTELSDPIARARFLHLIWSTDFATREAADAALDEGPLYGFPRADAVAAAIHPDWKLRLDAGIDDELRLLEIPLLVLHGERDPEPDGARHVAEIAPQATWAPILDAGHSPWLEHPTEVRRHLRDFLSSLDLNAR